MFHSGLTLPYSAHWLLVRSCGCIPMGKPIPFGMRRSYDHLFDPATCRLLGLHPGSCKLQYWGVASNLLVRSRSCIPKEKPIPFGMGRSLDHLCSLRAVSQQLVGYLVQPPNIQWANISYNHSHREPLPRTDRSIPEGLVAFWLKM